jgi:hypothetical protein
MSPGFDQLCIAARLRMVELRPSGIAHIVRALGSLSQMDPHWNRHDTEEVSIPYIITIAAYHIYHTIIPYQ